MKKNNKTEIFYSDGIVENSKRFSQEIKIIDKEEIEKFQNKESLFIREKILSEKKQENEKRIIKEEKKIESKDLNNDGKPDYQNEQESIQIIRINKERRIRKKMIKKERELERELKE